MRDFWRGRRVFVTGHSGFMGSWLVQCLHKLGATVCGYALPPSRSDDLFVQARLNEIVQSYFGDIADIGLLSKCVESFEPDFVVHLAAQAFVKAGIAEPVETFRTNLLGTVHVLEAIRRVSSVSVGVFVTTDKVYAPTEGIHHYLEDDRLGGKDPYSSSKAACELAINSYRSTYFEATFPRVVSVRAGNIIGGGDWGNHRLIPDLVRASRAGEPLRLRMPSAIRPWQHALEPVVAYLRIIESAMNNANISTAFNVGPDAGDHLSVREVVKRARCLLKDSGPLVQECSIEPTVETNILRLDNRLIKSELGIEPTWTTDKAIRSTMTWYKEFLDGNSARALCSADIDEFFEYNENKITSDSPLSTTPNSSC